MLIASSTAGSSCCSFLCLFHIFAFQQPNPTLFRYSLTFNFCDKWTQRQAALYWWLKNHYLFITWSTAGSTKSYTILLYEPNTVSKHFHCIYIRLFRLTYRLSILLALCHLLLSFKKDTHFIKGQVEYIGNIIVIIRLFVCWHQYFVTWFYIHTSYCIYF